MGRLLKGGACWIVIGGGALLAGCKGESEAPKRPAASFPGTSLKVAAPG